ncbi:MAG: hypothetical protein HY779_00665, partial [Rubrobacteridae bacterium]|nr:hypothetical protein [Rubrobacteridae bacterium]
MSVVEKIGDILIALSLIAVPVTFFLIVASESLQNYVKSSKLFTYLPGIDENRTALYIATYFAACLVFFTIILSLFKSVFIPTPEAAQSGDSTSSGTSSSQVASSDPAAQAESTSSASTDSTLNRFTIRAIETEMRSDDGYYVYVLIPPIDLAKNDYQARVENAVRGVSKSYGNKITVDVFDDEAALEL